MTVDGDECVCARCRCDYAQRDGSEPGEYCDPCAHVMVDELEAELAELRVGMQRRGALLEQGASVLDAMERKLNELATLGLAVEMGNAVIAEMQEKIERVEALAKTYLKRGVYVDVNCESVGVALLSELRGEP